MSASLVIKSLAGASAAAVLEKNLAATLLMTASGDEKRKITLQAGSTEPEAKGSTFYLFFMNAIVAGLVPPFSDFFYAVLSHYRLQALHLHPNFVSSC